MKRKYVIIFQAQRKLVNAEEILQQTHSFDFKCLQVLCVRKPECDESAESLSKNNTK